MRVQTTTLRGNYVVLSSRKRESPKHSNALWHKKEVTAVVSPSVAFVLTGEGGIKLRASTRKSYHHLNGCNSH